MHQQYARRIVSRFIILIFLTGALLALALPSRVNARFTTCNTCDENFYNCYTVQGGNYTSCRQTYNDCVAFCTFDTSSGGGGGSGGCGRGRTSCDLACNQARRDCLDSGGDTCGADYEACELACCP